MAGVAGLGLAWLGEEFEVSRMVAGSVRLRSRERTAWHGLARPGAARPGLARSSRYPGWSQDRFDSGPGNARRGLARHG
jgi:hypothetical protein